MDKYQERYEEHIQNKLKREQRHEEYSSEETKGIFRAIENRKSVRRFSGKPLRQLEIEYIIHKALDTAPSSCNRKGIYAVEVSPVYAESILVGGKGWAGKADKVYFLWGAKECYKNPKEISYMPYLDAGFVGQNIYLLCELYGIGCCFINPNTTEPPKGVYDGDYFVGAVAVGDYE